MRVLALLNRGALPLSRDLAGEVRDAFSRCGVDAEVEVIPPGDVEERFRRARDAGFDGMVAGGGDGTISSAARALAGTPIPLGVLPLGTLNNFAKDAGIPTTMDGAVAVVADGHVEAVDVAEVNGRVFLNNSSIGAYPRFVREREARERQGIPRAIAEGAALLRFVGRFPGYHVRFSGGAENGETVSPMVFVGNNRYRVSLSGFGRRERLDEGLLFLFVVCCRTRLCSMREALRALFGRPGVASLSVVSREVRIDALPRLVPVATDGEVARLTPPLIYRIRPRDLKVFRPAAAKRTGP